VLIYAKLKDNKLEYAPKSVTINNVYYNPTPTSYLTRNGYKVVYYTEQPEAKEGYYYEPKWVEDENSINQTWVEKKYPEPEPTSSDKVEAIVIYNMMMGTLLDPEEVTE
jgi:hypothetical protein